MDRIPLEFLQKFYRIGQKRTYGGDDQYSSTV
ncbi:hypothetical protein OESDEN_20981 [Oesophagostomum dentatum]|uniref:Uncharacterized protein n=1 Tax=Oesophagostomum dentatum TaxID=61180 RepID=A0A0B1S1Y9_OESDE|nr:hypothetical protein OESDEN_20981 [Oesophagostomum dentatum]